MIYWQQTPFLAVIDGGGGVFLVKKEEVLKEFIFDCQMRKLSERTIKGYRNSNKRLF